MLRRILIFCLFVYLILYTFSAFSQMSGKSDLNKDFLKKDGSYFERFFVKYGVWLSRWSYDHEINFVW